MHVATRANKFIATNDKVIRVALRTRLEKIYKRDKGTKIIDELGIVHGSARVDIAVINGVIHGYELKSDVDTLNRLPEQARIYNLVMDKMTLVVGEKHAYEAIKIVPDWWGVQVVKMNSSGKIIFYEIREDRQNLKQDKIAIASLLWREEALNILERIGHAKGMKSQPRKQIYRKLAKVIDSALLKLEVKEYLFSRINWRFD